MSTSRPHSMGELLGGAFRIYRQHVIVLVVTAAALGLPGALGGFGRPEEQHSLAAIGMAVVGGLLGLLASVVAIGQVATALRGSEPTLADGVAMGVRRLLPVLCALVWQSLFVLVVVALPLAAVLGALGLMAWRASTGIGDPQFLLVASALALVFLTVTTYLLVRYFAVLQIATLEPGSPWLRRSAALARGGYARIGVVWLVVSVIHLVPAALYVAGMMGVLVATGEEEGVSAILLASELGSWLVNALVVPLAAALTTVLYFEQRVRNDGYDLQLPASGATPGTLPGALARPVG